MGQQFSKQVFIYFVIALRGLHLTVRALWIWELFNLHTMPQRTRRQKNTGCHKETKKVVYKQIRIIFFLATDQNEFI